MENPPATDSQRYSLNVKFDLWVISWLVGLTFLLSSCSASGSNNPSPATTPLSVSNEEVKNYARTVIAIEPSRIATFKEIKELSKSGKVPAVNCTQQNSLKALSRQAQEIAINYCNQAKRIGESNGLTMARFNAITSTARSNPELQRRIQNELIRLQG